MAKKVIDEQLLLKIALDEFSTQSFDDASLNRIISNAGITKGSFYYRFANKNELYIALLKEGNRLKWAYIKEQTPVATETVDLFDNFLLQAEVGVKFASLYPEYYKLGKLFSKEKGSEIYPKVLKELNQDSQIDLYPKIEALFNSGYFKDEYSLDFILKIVNSLLLSFDEILFADEDYELEKAVAYLRQFVFFLKMGFKRL